MVEDQVHGSQAAFGAGVQWRPEFNAWPTLRLKLEAETYDRDASFIGVMATSGF